MLLCACTTMNRKRRWSDDELKNAAKLSTSYRQVLIRLGLRPVGGNYAQIRKYLSEHHVETSHFKGMAWNRGLRGIGKPIIPIELILVKHSTYQSFKLKKRLFDLNLKDRNCEECGWAKIAEGGYLPLELDHINGNRHDNRLENLRILCPNCHSLKPTHRGRMGRGKKKVSNAGVAK